MTILTVLLYMLLGFALSQAGLTISNKWYWIILGIVVSLDILSFLRAIYRN